MVIDRLVARLGSVASWIGSGINTGVVIAGTIGESDAELEFTLIGDAVSVAAPPCRATHRTTR